MATAEIVQTFSGAALQFAKIDAHAEFGAVFLLRADWTDIATADVPVFSSNAPFAFRVTDVWLENTAGNGANANSIQVCAGAGATDDITEVISLNGVADKAIVRCATLDDAFTVAEGGSLFLSLVKAGGTMGGVAWILCVTQ